MDWNWSSESSRGRPRGPKGVAEEDKEEKSMNGKIMNKEKKKSIEEEEEEEEEEDPMDSLQAEHTKRKCKLC